MIFTDPTIPASTRDLVYRLLARDRLPQSILLTGGSARLREKCAMELAMSVFCLSPNEGQPCQKCPASHKLKVGAHPDLIRVAPEDGKKSVSIKTARDLVLDSLYIAPNEADAKLYYIPEADEMSDVVQNALLKTIEEPPPFVGFILTAALRESFLPTVVSRVTEFPLGQLKESERRQKTDVVGETAAKIAAALCRGTEFDLLLATSPMVKNRAMMKRTAQKLILVVRDALADGAGEDLSGLGREAALLRATYDTAGLLKLKTALDKVTDYADKNANENLLISQFSSLLAQVKKRKEER